MMQVASCKKLALTILLPSLPVLSSDPVFALKNYPSAFCLYLCINDDSAHPFR